MFEWIATKIVVCWIILCIHESVHEILINLKEIVSKSNLYGAYEAIVFIRGLGYVTAQDIILQLYGEIVVVDCVT